MCVASAPARGVRPNPSGSNPSGYFSRGEHGASRPGERLRLTGRPPVRNSPVAVVGRGEGGGTSCAIAWILFNCEMFAKALPCTDAEESVAALEEASDASSSLSSIFRVDDGKGDGVPPAASMGGHCGHWHCDHCGHCCHCGKCGHCCHCCMGCHCGHCCHWWTLWPGLWPGFLNN